jgi:YfiH family protein
MAFALGPPGSSGGGHRLSELLGPDGPELVAVRWCRQVHGATVHRTGGGPPASMEVGDGDGLVTSDPKVGLAVWSADCVPVLLRLGATVAAVHAGWRGCAADVIGAAVRALVGRSGGAATGLDAALGPAVCGGCYEVGGEVVSALCDIGVDQVHWRSGNRVDLRGFIAARLEALGAAPENIQTVGGCTVESRELASYRRDGRAAGRQWSLVFLDR